MGSRGGMSSAAMAMAALLAVVLMAPGAAAQSSAPACAQKLIPCQQYLKTTTPPPESCCGQIKEAVQKELPCLCSLLNSKELLQAFNINITQALGLPKRCGVSSDTSICASVSNTNNTAAGAPSAPPATPGNGAAVARMGVSGLVVLLAFFWWSLVA